MLSWDRKEESSKQAEGELGKMLLTEGLSCAKALR